MLKKFFKDLVIVCTMVVVLTTGFLSNVFAVSDSIYTPRYEVSTDSLGVNKFNSKFPGLSPLIYNGGDTSEASCNSDSCSSNVSGDLSIELGNPFCLTYIGLFSLAMYAGNAAVKATAIVSLLAAAVTIYSVAAFKLQDFEICGADWFVWGSEGTEDMNDAGALKNFKKYYPSLGAFSGSKKYAVVNCMKDISTCVANCKNSKADCVLDLDFMNKQGRNYLTVNDKAYRERTYDGEEIKSDECTDPRPERKDYDVGGNEQLYYMRGFAPANYACDRFLILKQNDGDQYDDAYKCCIKSSKKICVKDKFLSDGRDPKAFFCETGNGKLCTHDAFILQVNGSGDADNEYCVSTWSLCPYNFNIQRGTTKMAGFKKTVTSDGTVSDECVEAGSDGVDTTLSCQGKIKNFYQYKRHCTTVEKWVDKNFDNDTDYPAFIDKACINFVGSSHNTEGYRKYSGYYKMFDTYKSFTAPVAECISETLKNFLFNRAGHTKCVKGGELPNEYGECVGDVAYREGDDLKYVQGRITPTSNLLIVMKHIITMMLVLMVSLYGYGILINSGKITLKDMMIAMLKVVFVITFSSSVWWYDQLFKFTYGFSNAFSNITMKIGFDDTQDIEGNYIKYDGCYFGDINNILSNESNYYSTPNLNNKGYTENNYYLYPSNRKYVSFFDTLDCKVRKYLGYGSEADAAVDIIRIIAASLIWPFGQLNLYFGVATVMLGLFVIFFAIKAAYIFVASSIALTIMLYISPMVIPCILFKKTKGVFDKWLKNTISFALQPMVLFAFVSMSLTVMDKYSLGEGIYSGTKLNRDLICGYACVDANNGSVIKYIDSRGSLAYQNFSTVCGENDIVDLKRGSVLCFLNKQSTQPLSILQSIGIIIPSLMDLFLNDAISFLRVAFLFFILTKTLNTVPAVAAEITGGKALPGTSSADPFEVGAKILGMMKAVRRGLKNAGQKMFSKKDKPSGGDDKKDGDDKQDGDKGGKMTGVSVRDQGQQGGSNE